MALDQKHAFWSTQPVGSFNDADLPEGPIDTSQKVSDVPTEPDTLPASFEWTTCDLDSQEIIKEVYTLLTNNYVEDDSNMFRFNYSQEFLHWALRPPGYHKEWHLGVRAKTSGKLVAFITGVPARMRVKDKVVEMAEINFLCVHKKLRSKRLAPVLIKEVTRQVHLKDIWQASYTGGSELPTPISKCQYWHRSLNPKKLIEVGFSSLAQRMTMARTIKLYKLPEDAQIPGIRPMELGDVPAVTKLLQNYLQNFLLAPVFTEAEVEHMLVPQPDVVDSFVVEDSTTHELTDFTSFYTLPSTVTRSTSHSTLKAAYSFYNVATRVPLEKLMNDALILAKQRDFDVFNALNIHENDAVFKSLKFGPGDGYLHYYLYNYRISEPLKPQQVGLVLL